MSDEITEESLEGIDCILCGDDLCCPYCSYINTDEELVGMCHDCGEELNYES